MVDAVDSKSSGGNLVSVQIRPSAITYIQMVHGDVLDLTGRLDRRAASRSAVLRYQRANKNKWQRL